MNLQVLYPQAEHERGGQREELQQERRVLQREGSLGRTRIFGLGVLVVGHLGPLDSPSADSFQFLELRPKHAPLRPFHARHCGPRVARDEGTVRPKRINSAVKTCPGVVNSESKAVYRK